MHRFLLTPAHRFRRAPSSLTRRPRRGLGQKLRAEQLETRALLTTLFVDADAASGGDGLAWDSAYDDLQNALAVAVAGDEVWVAGGTFKPTAGSDRTISFDLKSGVRLYGGFAGTETDLSERDWEANVTTLSGDIDTVGNYLDNSYHVVSVTNADTASVIDGFTVTAGNADGDSHSYGGGIYSNLASPTLANVTLSGNVAGSGGGIYLNGGSPTLTNVTISDNFANWSGGGIYNANSSPTLTNVTVSGNTAEYSFGGNGGGIYNFNSSPTLVNVSISDNSAGGLGGGMFNSDHSAPILMNVMISGNSSWRDDGGGGGGIYNINSSPTLTHVIISDNSANTGAGGISNFNSSPTLTNVTISGNSGGAGAGIYNANSSPILTNVTISGNSADNGAGGISNFNSSPTLTNVTISGNSGTWAGGIGNSNNSSPILTNVTISGNSAGSFGDFGGGGINNSENSSPTLTNVIISGNSGDRAGGIFNSENSSPALTNVTISGNSGGTAGGILNSESSSPTLMNSVLWGNTSRNEGPQIYSEDAASTTTFSYSIVEGGWSGTGNLDSDPLFVDPVGGDFRLLPSSPAIDAGNNAAVPPDVLDLDGDGVTGEPTPFDLGGLPRFFEVASVTDTGNGAPPIVDMGAYESQFVNSSPIAAQQHVVAHEDEPQTITLMASDPDPGPLTFSVVANPTHGTLTDFNPATGTVIYRPAADYHGVDSFMFKANDGTADSNVASVNITITAVEDAVDDEVETLEDASAVIDVLANDNFEHDAAYVRAVTQAVHGTVTIKPDGTIIYTPDPDFVGSDSFSYSVRTGAAGATNTETASVNVTVSAQADVVADSAAATEDTPRIIDVLANDHFEDAAAFVSSVTQGTHGTVTINPDGTVTYLPAADFHGVDTFSYSVTTYVAGPSNTETSTVSVSVAPQADIVANTAAAQEDATQIIDVLANDVFDDPDAYVSAVSAGSHGAVTINPDGTLSYTPAPDFHGVDSFSYTVTTYLAGPANTETASVTLTVAPEADIVEDLAETDEDTAVIIDVLANDDFEDPDAEVSAVSAGSHGTVTINPDGTLTYLPEPDYYGADSFTYTVTTYLAGPANTETGTVYVTVLAAPEPGGLGENLLVNPGFELPEETTQWLPTTFGDWGGDLTAIVGGQNGILPQDSQMLHFLGTFVTGTGGRTSDLLQYVDLAPFADLVATGQLTALLTANFNRVARNDQTDSEFDLVLAAHEGTPESSPGQTTSLAHEIAALITDGDVGTWQSVSVELNIPVGADFLQVTLSAIENLFDNLVGVEFDGHYADNASLILYRRGDFDFDGILAAADIDELSAKIRAGQYDRLMDLDRNGLLNFVDRRIWIEDLMHTTYGDANLDGQFNSSDLVQMLAAGEYVDEIFGNSGWAEGDFGGDGEFDTDDLVLALQTGAYERPRAAVS